ncbi:protein KASH5 isoform X4 [Ciconia boyciana]|uniref:protein KASH5 isoform X4 n=1 Tax=Ciconia boyciana TaxID=52775 RepID=UPI003BA2F102
MAAEGAPAPSPGTPGAAVPPREAALPAAETETLQDLSQTAQGSAATRQGESCCSEEFIINCIFTTCDTEQTGTVLAQQVVEYLQVVTGQSSEEGQLRVLRHMLDPKAAGMALDLPTFHAVMREWITSCQQEGGSWLAEEQDAAAGDLGLVLAAVEGHTALAAVQLEGDGGNTDIMSPSTEAASLRSRAEQLATQNAKLHRDAELAEELNACLAEEMAQLKAQLRWSTPKCQCPAVPGSSQQALEQARAAAEELEDLKAVAKGLEEENSELRQQARQLVRGPASSLPVSAQPPLRCQAGTRGSSSGPCAFPPQEKEQQCQCSRADSLQEEKRQLLAEGCGLREQIQGLAAEKADLEARLCRCTALLSSRDAALAQAGQQVEELTVALGEYDRVVQELRLETTRLRNQLGRMQDAWAVYVAASAGPGGTRGWDALAREPSSGSSVIESARRLWCPLGEADVLEQPLGTEIEATCRVRVGARVPWGGRPGR